MVKRSTVQKDYRNMKELLLYDIFVSQIFNFLFTAITFKSLKDISLALVLIGAFLMVRTNCMFGLRIDFCIDFCFLQHIDCVTLYDMIYTYFYISNCQLKIFIVKFINDTFSLLLKNGLCP